MAKIMLFVVTVKGNDCKTFLWQYLCNQYILKILRIFESCQMRKVPPQEEKHYSFKKKVKCTLWFSLTICRIGLHLAVKSWTDACLFLHPIQQNVSGFIERGLRVIWWCAATCSPVGTVPTGTIYKYKRGMRGVMIFYLFLSPLRIGQFCI